MQTAIDVLLVLALALRLAGARAAFDGLVWAAAALAAASLLVLLGGLAARQWRKN